PRPARRRCSAGTGGARAGLLLSWLRARLSLDRPVVRKAREGVASQRVELGFNLGDAQLPFGTWKHVQIIGSGGLSLEPAPLEVETDDQRLDLSTRVGGPQRLELRGDLVGVEDDLAQIPGGAGLVTDVVVAVDADGRQRRAVGRRAE